MFSRKPKPAQAGLFVFALLAASLALAQPPLTSIQDILYKADGTTFTGLVIIEWKTFEASNSALIARNRVQQQVKNGVLSVRLVPTTTAGTNAYYSIRYISEGSTQYTETWAVKPSSTPLKVKDVRIADPLLGPVDAQGGGAANPIEIDEVNGLRQELDSRTRQAVTFVPERAVFINSSGEVESIAGTPGDCVRVDGTSGPCGTGGGSGGGGGAGATFVDGETPLGTVDGSNTSFTLSQSPNPASSLLLYRNGLLQKGGADFTLSAATLTFLANSVPQTGDFLLAAYRTSGASGTLSQVICSVLGNTTSQTTSTSLGSCVIPGGLLRDGDRVEIFFDYRHTGTAVGFQYQVFWGGASMVSRSAVSTVATASGRASIGIGAVSSMWSAQSWGGATLTLAVDSGTAAETLSAPITVDFRGWMSQPTTDTVTLRNLSVIRHPAP